jgi:alpha-tubulin suppressor-like RCC1 family protein
MQTPYVEFHLADQTETTIKFPRHLLKYFVTFDETIESGINELQEDNQIKLHANIWRYLLEVYEIHDECFWKESDPMAGLEIALDRNERTEMLRELPFSDIYDILRASNFYNIPLLQKYMLTSLAQRLFELNEEELYLLHREIQKPSVLVTLERPVNPILLSKMFLISMIIRRYMDVEDLARLFAKRFIKPLLRGNSLIACGAHTTLLVTQRGLYRSHYNNNKQKLILELPHFEYIEIDQDEDPIVSVVCGEQHQLILKMSGAVYGSGQNTAGQLGLGFGTEEVAGFIPVMDDDDDDVVVSMIACGLYHSVFLMLDGTVKICGNNTYGQLAMSDKIFHVHHPIRLNDFKEVSYIACGKYSTFIVTGNDIFAFGNNDSCQLGIGISRQNKSVCVPHKVPLNVSIISIVSFRHTVFLDSDGSLYMTGANEFGQLALDDRKMQGEPTKIDLPFRVTSVACGHSYTIALTNDGSLYVAGRFKGLMVGRDKSTSFVKLSGHTILTMSSGFNHVILFKKDGLYGIGENMCGQLGFNRYDDRIDEITKIPIVTGYEDPPIVSDLLPPPLENDEEEPQRKRRRLGLILYEKDDRVI